MEAEKLHFRAAQLCAEARSLFDDNVHDARAKEHLRNLVEVVNVLDSDYQHWVDKYFASNKWGYRVDTLPFKSPLSIDKVVYTYRDIWIGNVWLGHFSKRTHLHSVILHCVSLLGPGDPLHDQNGYSRSVIARMVSGLCASIPFMLGEIDSSGRRVTKAKKIALGGYLLVCGLQIGRQAVEEGSETEKLFLHTFEHIDKNMGIRSARLLAASRRKQSWQPIEF